MALDYKSVKQAIHLLADKYHLPESVAEDTLKEALAKGFRKHINISDIMVKVVMDDASQKIRLYQQKEVVSGEPDDDELQIGLEDAKQTYPDIMIGDMYDIEIPDAESIAEFGRGDVALVKNVLRQKTREAQKQEVYDKYIDRVDDMVKGTVDKVEDRFVIVKLDGAEALMPRSEQMPQDYYVKGQEIRVVITDVNKDSKGSQVLVSRASKSLVRRLFESEVPEVHDGIVEIRALAREVGERSKMAVYSNDPTIDAVGACIGQKGSRVQVIINELKNEKIDIFEWSENVEELIAHSLAPAEIRAVIPGKEPGSLIVVVNDDQLSLAIGRRGTNVRLAVNLVERKLDIKSVSTLEEEGVDWMAIAEQQKAKQEEEKAAAEAEKNRREAEMQAQREAMLKAQEEERIAAQKAAEEAEAARKAAEEAARIAAETAQAEEEAVRKAAEALKSKEEEQKSEPVVETKPEPQVPLFEEVRPEETAEKQPEKKHKARTVVASDYVSRFESLADAKSTSSSETTYKRKKKKTSDDEKKLRLKDMLKDKDYEIRPEYSEEELAEIEEQEQDYDSRYDEDIDYDEYDKYYDEED